jgi:hypothetical protein
MLPTCTVYDGYMMAGAMRSADTIDILCSTPTLEPRNEVYASRTTPSQDFHQGPDIEIHVLGPSSPIPLCSTNRSKASYHLRFGLWHFHHTHTARAVKSFQHHRRKHTSLYTKPSIPAFMDCNTHRVNAIHCTTTAYNFSTIPMNLLHFLPAYYRHHLPFRSQR